MSHARAQILDGIWTIRTDNAPSCRGTSLIQSHLSPSIIVYEEESRGGEDSLRADRLGTQLIAYRRILCPCAPTVGTYGSCTCVPTATSCFILARGALQPVRIISSHLCWARLTYARTERVGSTHTRSHRARTSSVPLDSVSSWTSCAPKARAAMWKP